MNNIQKAFKNKAGELYSRGKAALGGLRGGQPGAPVAPTVNPATVSGGISNADRLSAAARANPAGTSVSGAQSSAPASGRAPGARVEYAADSAKRAETMSAARNARVNAVRPPPVAPAPPVAGGLAKAPNKTAAFAKGVGTKVVAPLAAFDAIKDSAAVDSTARYAKRFGVSEPTGDGSAGDMLKFAGLRAGGFASDLGNSLTLGAAGNLYRDKPDGLLQFNGEPKAAPAPVAQVAPAQAAPVAKAPVAPPNAEDTRVSQELLSRGVSVADQGDSRFTYPDAQASSMRHDAGLGARKDYKLGGGQYDTSNADIFATSTRPDGKLNSFTGVGNANRPNWEDRPENRQNHLDAVARAAKDKASVSALAVGNINGTADGLDRAYRLAAGDPEATAAVENAVQQRGLRQAALNGNSGAANILAQQGKDATDVQVANITAGGGLRVAQAKAQADMLKAQQDQKNSDRTFGLAQNADTRAGGKQRRDEVQRALEGKLGKQFDKDGNLSPAWVNTEAALRNTLQGRTNPDGTPMTMDTLPDQELEQLTQTLGLSQKGELKNWRKILNWLMGDSKPSSNEIESGLRPAANSASESWLGGYTWKDQDGREKFSDDLTYDEQIALGIRPERAQ